MHVIGLHPEYIWSRVCICSSARQKLPLMWRQRLISLCVVLSFHKWVSVCVCVEYAAHLCDHFTLNWRPSHWTRHVTNYYTESIHVFVCVCVLGVVFDGYNNTGCVICSIWVGLPVGFWFIMAGQSGKSIQRSAVGDSSAVTCTDRRQSKWFTTTSFRSCNCIPKERGVISFSHKANL